MNATIGSAGRRLRRWLRPLAVAAGAVVTLAVLAVYVFPTRTWLDQRSALDETRAELEELQAERRALEEHLDRLDDPAFVEALARAEYGLVRPGEEAYAVLAPPRPPVELPELWPFGSPVVADPD